MVVVRQHIFVMAYFHSCPYNFNSVLVKITDDGGIMKFFYQYLFKCGIICNTWISFCNELRSKVLRYMVSGLGSNVV